MMSVLRRVFKGAASSSVVRSRDDVREASNEVAVTHAASGRSHTPGQFLGLTLKDRALLFPVSSCHSQRSQSRVKSVTIPTLTCCVEA